MNRTEHKFEIVAQGQVPQRSCARRIALWTVLLLCGLTIGIILMSQPLATAQLQRTSDFVAGHFSSASTPAKASTRVQISGGAASAALAIAAPTKEVFRLPRTSVPVRRAGVIRSK